MTSVTIIGRLTADPRCGRTSNDTPYANFVIADNVNDDTCYFHAVTLFGNAAKIAKKYLKKGFQCAVVGVLSVREYETEDGETRKVTEIVGHSLKLLGSGKPASERMDEADDEDDPFDEDEPKKSKKSGKAKGTKAKKKSTASRKKHDEDDDDDFDDGLPF